VHELLGCPVEIVQRNELHRFAVIPKRWVVERSFARLGKRAGFRKTLTAHSASLNIAALAFFALLLKRL
jgi:transposase